MRTNRIEGLADAIFAIVMTLMILEIRLPAHLDTLSSAQIGQALTDLVPEFLTFFLSFVILGTLWIGHHNQMNFIHKSDRTFLWLNIVFFMFVSLVPFSAAFLGGAPFVQPSVIFYAVNLSLCSLGLYAVWRYAVHKKLTSEEVTEEFARHAARRILTAPAWYLLAFAASFVPGRFAFHFAHFCFIAPILFFILPGRVDRFFRREEPA